MFALSDKKAVVTGASGGIGGAISAALHAQGFSATVLAERRAQNERLFVMRFSRDGGAGARRDEGPGP